MEIISEKLSELGVYKLFSGFIFSSGFTQLKYLF